MKYEIPRMEIIKLEIVDVVRTSTYHDPENPKDSTDASDGF